MSNLKNFAKLRNTLANFYPNVPDAQLIVDDAGLRRENINFNTNARNTWHGILLEASKVGQLANLIEIAGENYPAIGTVYNEFLNNGGEIPSLDNERPSVERHKITLFSLTIWKLTVAITIGSLLFVLVFQWPQVIQTLKKIYENLKVITETSEPLTPTLTPSESMTATPTLSFTITSESGQATLAPLNTLTSQQVQPAAAPIVTPVFTSLPLSPTPSFTSTVGTVTPTPWIPLMVKILIHDLTNTPVVNGKHPSVPSEMLTPGAISILLTNWPTTDWSSLSSSPAIPPAQLTNWPTTDWSSLSSLSPISTTKVLTSIAAGELISTTQTISPALTVTTTPTPSLTPTSILVTFAPTPSLTLTFEPVTATLTPALTPMAKPVTATPTSSLTPIAEPVTATPPPAPTAEPVTATPPPTPTAEPVTATPPPTPTPIPLLPTSAPSLTPSSQP